MVGAVGRPEMTVPGRWNSTIVGCCAYQTPQVKTKKAKQRYVRFVESCCTMGIDVLRSAQSLNFQSSHDFATLMCEPTGAFAEGY